MTEQMPEESPGSTHRLHDDLGGWPVRVVDDENRAMGMGVRAIITEGPYKGSMMILRSSHLIKLPLPLPDEPPAWSVVHARLMDEDQPAVCERSPSGSWWTTSGHGPFSWEDLNKHSTPVLLVPVPFQDAPELPWQGDGMSVEVGTASGLVVVEVDERRQKLTADLAQTWGLALFAAARAITKAEEK